MHRESAAKIKQELMLHGATARQAEGYIAKIRETERLSEERGQAHHILPVNCGWWKKYKDAKWNLVRVESGLHAELHARLFWIFPDNRALGQALKFIARSLFSRSYHNDRIIDRQKDKIIRFYAKHTLLETAAKFRTSDQTLVRHLKRWGVRRVRGQYNQMLCQDRLVRKRSEILKFYMTHTFQETCKKFDVGYKTMLLAFKRMGLRPRTRGEAIALIKQRQKEQGSPAFAASVGNLRPLNAARKRSTERLKTRVQKWLAAGETAEQIAKRTGLTPRVIRKWWEKWGFTSPRKRKGDKIRQMAEHFGIDRRTVYYHRRQNTQQWQEMKEAA
jgi:DNA-binding CsgD family transcriptional regulator